MAAGWLKAADKPEISVYAPRPTPLVSKWVEQGEVMLNPERKPADILVVAVKPQVFGNILDEARPLCDEGTLVISVMAAWCGPCRARRALSGRALRCCPVMPA